MSDQPDNSKLKQALKVGVASMFVAMGAASGAAAATPPDQAPQADIPETMEVDGNTYSNFKSLNIETAYSKKLSTLKDEYMPLMPAHIRSVSVIDLDTATAMDDVGGKELTHLHIQERLAADNIYIDQDTTEGIYSYLDQNKTTLAYESNPFALNPDDQSDVCIVMPASHTSNIAQINGLSAGDIANYIARHELRHCEDDKFPSPTANDVVSDTYKAVSKMLAKESYADVSAAGDMMTKEGKPLEIIENISTWRYRLGHADIAHFTSPSLMALRQEILDMGGVEKFKALPEAQREEIYIRVVEENSATPSQLSLADRIRDNPEERAKAEAEALKDPKAAEDLLYNDRWLEGLDRQAKHGSRLQNVDQAVEEAEKWDAEGEMRARAAKLSGTGEVTPLGLLRARTAMIDDLRREGDAQPDNALFPAKELRVRDAFIIETDALNAAAPTEIASAKPAAAAPAKPQL